MLTCSRSHPIRSETPLSDSFDCFTVYVVGLTRERVRSRLALKRRSLDSNSGARRLNFRPSAASADFTLVTFVDGTVSARRSSCGTWSKADIRSRVAGLHANPSRCSILFIAGADIPTAAASWDWVNPRTRRQRAIG